MDDHPQDLDPAPDPVAGPLAGDHGDDDGAAFDRYFADAMVGALPWDALITLAETRHTETGTIPPTTRIITQTYSDASDGVRALPEDTTRTVLQITADSEYRVATTTDTLSSAGYVPAGVMLSLDGHTGPIAVQCAGAVTIYAVAS